MTNCFPNKITKNRDQNLHPTAQSQAQPKPLHTHSPSCSRHCLTCVARSLGSRLALSLSKGHPEGLALTPASVPFDKLRAHQCQCPSTSSGHIPINAQDQVQTMIIALMLTPAAKRQDPG